MPSPYNTELRRIRFIPQFSYGPRIASFIRRAKVKPSDPGPGVRVDEITVSDTASIRLFRPAQSGDPVPALLWMHGGGHVVGSPEQDDRTNVAFVRELGIAVAAVRYRLGADAPAPASVEDCYAALKYLASNAATLGVDPDLVAIGGASAGGGVAAGLVLYAHDKAEVDVAFQLLVYPMLDDRTVTRKDMDTSAVRVWLPKSNRYGWATYLAAEPGSDGVSPYAAPARREDLTGLPPTWIGFGSVDLFHDEDVEYARRLTDARVPTTLEVVPGAFHGFDALFPKTSVAQAFWKSQADALRAAGIVSAAKS